MKRACSCIAILVAYVQGTLAWAGKLDDFEKDAKYGDIGNINGGSNVILVLAKKK